MRLGRACLAAAAMLPKHGETEAQGVGWGSHHTTPGELHPRPACTALDPFPRAKKSPGSSAQLKPLPCSSPSSWEGSPAMPAPSPGSVVGPGGGHGCHSQGRSVLGGDGQQGARWRRGRARAQRELAVGPPGVGEGGPGGEGTPATPVPLTASSPLLSAGGAGTERSPRQPRGAGMPGAVWTQGEGQFQPSMAPSCGVGAQCSPAALLCLFAGLCGSPWGAGTSPPRGLSLAPMVAKAMGSWQRQGDLKDRQGREGSGEGNGRWS